MTTTTETVRGEGVSTRRAATPAAAAAEPRWVRWITWAAILAPLPYSVSRLLWAAGIPFDISEAGLRDLGAPGWGSLYLLLLALLSEGTGLFTHTFVLSHTRTVPRWIPVLRARTVRPRIVIAALLPIAILTFADLQSAVLLAMGDFPPANDDGVAPRSIWQMAITFWVWGVALTIATVAYHCRTRDRRRGGPRTAAN